MIRTLFSVRWQNYTSLSLPFKSNLTNNKIQSSVQLYTGISIGHKNV